MLTKTRLSQRTSLDHRINSKEPFPLLHTAANGQLPGLTRDPPSFHTAYQINLQEMTENTLEYVDGTGPDEFPMSIVTINHIPVPDYNSSRPLVLRSCQNTRKLYQQIQKVQKAFETECRSIRLLGFHPSRISFPLKTNSTAFSYRQGNGPVATTPPPGQRENRNAFSPQSPIHTSNIDASLQDRSNLSPTKKGRLLYRLLRPVSRVDAEDRKAPKQAEISGTSSPSTGQFKGGCHSSRLWKEFHRGRFTGFGQDVG